MSVNTPPLGTVTNNGNSNINFSNFLEKLNLNSREKLGVKDFFKVDKTIFGDDELTSPAQIPEYILQKLMIVDYHVREFSLKPKVKLNDIDNEDDDEDNEIYETPIDELEDLVNPMDAFLALFHCCDNFLRQHLALKLTACQLSVPFLLPDPDKPSENITMLLWSLSGIKKSWKTIENGSEVDSQAFVTRHPFPIVSFVRLGEVGISKSKLINKTLSDLNGHRDFFFHKDCKGGGVERKFVDGLVELCWYLPGGRTGQAFEKEICVANLRGDGKIFKNQLGILSRISSLIVILLSSTHLDDRTKEILEKTIGEEKKVLLVFQDRREKQLKQYYDCLKKKSQDNFNVIIKALKNNDYDFVMAVRNKIQQHTKDVQSLPLKDLSNLAKKHGLVVDQSSCEINTKFIGKFEKWLKKYPKQPKTRLRLQSMIPKIAYLERENVRPTQRGNKSEEEYNNEIQSKLEQVRNWQKHAFKKISTDVQNFLHDIPSMSEVERNYSLTVLKEELDNVSLKILVPLQSSYRKEYEDLKEEIDKMQTNSENKQECHAHEQRLRELDKKMIDNSFGLEHIFREMAQIVSLTDVDRVDYAGAAARLLLSGRCLELMDGDSSYIPLKWFNGVFDKLKTLTNDAKIFVISVLGIQSSGKSTMLNTMFGLEFPVSAGRCTRGAFASLVPLSDLIRNDTEYSFLLIVDTEGLKGSADSNLREHDNELATFAIGVADLTIVNIFGENYSEMKEFLEIAVHAFLKMKLAKEKRICQIVHQNITALEASFALVGERVNLRKTLDEMTELAAIEENCESDFKKLNDVLTFDENKDVFYIPSMLQGCQPMAPMNPEYGKASQKVKENIVKMLYLSENSPLRISMFQKRVNDLWDAIRRENFIFSFRNTIEVRAYTSLDRKLFQVSVNTAVAMGEQEKTTSIALESSPPEELKNEWSRQKRVIRKAAEKQFKIMKQEMEIFFQKNQDKNTLKQWRTKTMNRIERMKDDEEDEVIKNCHTKFQYLESRQEYHIENLNYKEKILSNVKVFITSLEQRKHDDKFIINMFDTQWEHWLSTIPEHKPERLDVNAEMINVLYEHNKKLSVIIQKKLQEHNYHVIEFEKIIPVSKIIDKNLENSNLLKKFFRRKPEFAQDAEVVRDKAVDAAWDFAKKIFRSNERCRRADLVQMYQIILENAESETVTFQDEIICDILLHCFAKTFPIFENMEERFLNKHDIKLDLESNLKPELQNYFLSQCKIVNKEVAAATLFVDVLKKPIQSEINQSMGLTVAKELLTISEFQSKGQFHAKRLIELGEADSFDNYISYLENPVKFLKANLQKCVEVLIKENLGAICLQKQVESTRKKIFDIITSTTEQVRLSGQGIYKWIDIFVESCSTFAVTKDTVSVVKIDEDLEDFKVFESEVKTKVNDFFVDILAQRVDHSVCEQWQPQPCDKLSDLMFGCEKCCPFCGALCDQTWKEHESSHSTRNHRPTGIRASKWIESGILLTEICTTLVAGKTKFKNVNTNQEWHPYKDYQTVNDYYKSWSIAPDVSFEASHYWKWFMAKYAKELAEYYSGVYKISIKPPEIPSSWHKITFQEAKSNLEDHYNL